MGFEGFSQKDFETFQVDGLDERMEAIQERIQPKFQKAGTELTEYLSSRLNKDMFLHIAKHARRSVNPPNDTWLAIAANKRGYKKHPHFQVGLFDDHIFAWLAFIYELPDKNLIAEDLMKEKDNFKELPKDFKFSLDHMKKDAFSIKDLSDDHLTRFRDVKKAEFLIGRHFSADDPVVKNGDTFLQEVKATFDELIPFYQLATSVK